MIYLKSEEYAGNKIWFTKSAGSVQAKTSIDGIWYSTIEESKKEAFHQIKILIVDILKKGNFQKHKNRVCNNTWNKFCGKVREDRYERINDDYWGRKTYKNIKTKQIIKDVDGVLHSCSLEGEPDSPLKYQELVRDKIIKR